MCMLACGGGWGCADFAVLYSFCGGRRFIILMAEGRSFGGAVRGAKGAAKVLHFPRKCNIPGFGAPDQREMRAKKGAKCYKKMFQWGCYTFGQKSGEIEASRERVFELILAARAARKCGCSRLVVCRRCTGFVYVLCRFPESSGRERPKPGCLPMYMKRVIFWGVSQIWDGNSSAGNQWQRWVELSSGHWREEGQAQGGSAMVSG